MTTMTFEFYSIHNGDSIVVLPQEDGHSQPIATHAWLSATRDADTFNDAITSILNPTTNREAARLRDLHWMSLERRPKSYQKVCSMFNDAQKQLSSFSSTLIPSEGAHRPSTDALPVAWNQRACFFAARR
jgi:hypothetical protein